MNWNITDTKDLEKYSAKIFEMYESSYKEIGLIDFGGWDGLKEYLNCSCYLLEDENKEMHGIILYWLSDYGNKISLVISETPEIGKIFVIPKLIELLEIQGFYVELSGALEYLVRKEGLDNIKNKDTILTLTNPNPNIVAVAEEDIFKKDDEKCKLYPLNPIKNIPSPEGSFLRNIKDIGKHRKALYGHPCLNKAFNSNKCDRICTSNGGKKNKTKKQKKQKKQKKMGILNEKRCKWSLKGSRMVLKSSRKTSHKR
jgi:hypothetical protein